LGAVISCTWCFPFLKWKELMLRWEFNAFIISYCLI
jgi:hypothetical protein